MEWPDRQKRHKVYAGIIVLILTTCAALFLLDDGREDYEKGMAAYAAEDWKTAADYFRIAAEKDNPHAQFMLAQCCNNRKGVEKTAGAAEWRSKAENTFQKRAKSGDPDAMYYLGVFQINYGNAPLRKRGMDWLGKSASKGNEKAHILLRSLERVEELKAAVENGDPDAMYELAEGYYNGITGIEYMDKAALLFYDAVKNGRADAIRGLQKIASATSLDSAQIYLGDLAEKGNKEAKDTLLNLAEKGEGIRGHVFFPLLQMAIKGDMEVLGKFTDLANKGNQDAVRALYLLAGDNEEALRTLISIAEKGNAKAIGFLKDLVRKNNNEDAVRALRKLADDGNPDAQQAVRELEENSTESMKEKLEHRKQNP